VIEGVVAPVDHKRICNAPAFIEIVLFAQMGTISAMGIIGLATTVSFNVVIA
jgi:hypothetical protein